MFSKDLVEVALFLIKSSGSRVGSLKINLKVFDFTDLALLSLFKRSALGLSRLDKLFHFLEFVGELLLSFFEFFGTLNSVSFVLSSPRSDLSVGFGETALKLSFRFLLFFILFTKKVV